MNLSAWLVLFIVGLNILLIYSGILITHKIEKIDLTALGDAADLLREEAAAIRDSQKAIEWMAYAVVGNTLVITLIAMLMWKQSKRQSLLIEGLAHSAEQWRILDEKQQKGIWNELKRVSKNFSRQM